MISSLNKAECVGCGSCCKSCPTHCIRMETDAEGFTYPHISEDACIGCNKCDQACPVLSTRFEPTSSLPESYIAWTTNEDDLMAATSGGVFTAIARGILSKGGTVVSAAYNSDNVVKHIVVNTVSDLYRLSRSKYSQSDLIEVFDHLSTLLAGNNPVLFCGTPCQVQAIQAYCRTHRLDTHSLFLIDLVCLGAPTPKLLSEYLSWAGSHAHSPVTTIAMRERCARGSFGSSSFTRLNFANGRTSLRNAGLDPLGYFIFNGYAMRPSCHQCSFKTVNRISDLTIGDCWFSSCLTEGDVPYEVTLCLVQSEAGKHLLEECSTIMRAPVNTLDAIKCNGGMIYTSCLPNPNRNAFLCDLENESFDDVIKTYLPFSLKRVVKRFRARVKPLLQRIANRTITKRAQKRQRQEFKRRMNRVIPKEAMGRRAAP